MVNMEAYEEARTVGVSSPERSEMAYVGLLLTNVASALRRGDVDHAMEQLQEAREIHADIMERE